MYSNTRTTSILLTVLLLSACATVPNGPSGLALPGTGKNFDQFHADDTICRQFAQEQIGGTTATQASNDSFARTAVLGTALGAAVGAVADGGHGAGIGAATGLLFGSIIGVNEANMSSSGAQHRYDNAYIQCMYAKGNQVPVSGRISTQRRPASVPAPAAYPPPPPPAGGYIPPPAGFAPPPAGNPPPPPPDAPR